VPNPNITIRNFFIAVCTAGVCSAVEMAERQPPRWSVHPMRVIFMISRDPPPALADRQRWSLAFHDFVTCCLVKVRRGPPRGRVSPLWHLRPRKPHTQSRPSPSSLRMQPPRSRTASLRKQVERRELSEAAHRPPQPFVCRLAAIAEVERREPKEARPLCLSLTSDQYNIFTPRLCGLMVR
jgi:hypothetical protein